MRIATGVVCPRQVTGLTAIRWAWRSAFPSSRYARAPFFPAPSSKVPSKYQRGHPFGTIIAL